MGVPIVENKTLYDYIKTNAQAICFEVACTTSNSPGGYVSKQHPKCYEYFYRHFGKQWLYVLGAMMSERLILSTESYTPYPIPCGYVYRKLLIAMPVKPSSVVYRSPEQHVKLSECVKNPVVGKEYPGYLATTRPSYIDEATKCLKGKIGMLGLTRVVVSPPFVTDNYITADEAIAIMAPILDERFIIARGGF